MSSRVHHLFVYGSLRSGFRSPAYDYISRFFTLVGEAKARGQLYDMGEYPAAVPDDTGHYIIGELYKIREEKEFSWAMGQLDDYEGISVEADETPLYRRDLTIVECNGASIESWIYWYSGDISNRPLVQSGDILQYMREKNRSL